MIINKTTEYAFTILGYMATRDEEIYSAESLYQELKIPRRYLRRLLTDLSRHGFLKSAKGRAGGFTFARKLENINFLQVIQAMEGIEAKNHCILGFTACIVDKPCVMHYSWRSAIEKVYETLEKTTLEDLRTKFKADSTRNLPTGIIQKDVKPKKEELW